MNRRQRRAAAKRKRQREKRQRGASSTATKTPTSSKVLSMEELEAKVKAGGLHAEWVLVGSKPTKDDVLSLMRWGEQRGQFLLRHVHYGYIPNKRDRETRDKLIEMIKNLGESLKYLRQVKTD